MALASQMKAVAAQKACHLAREIVPVTIPPKKGNPVVVSQDEHPRETSLETLEKLKPIVRPDGTMTAGNSSIKDGGADTQLPADLGHGQARFNVFERKHDLTISES